MRCAWRDAGAQRLEPRLGQRQAATELERELQAVDLARVRQQRRAGLVALADDARRVAVQAVVLRFGIALPRGARLREAAASRDPGLTISAPASGLQYQLSLTPKTMGHFETSRPPGAGIRAIERRIGDGVAAVAAALVPMRASESISWRLVGAGASTSRAGKS